MSTHDFCIWLHGYLRLSTTTSMEAEQIDILLNELEKVLKEDPHTFSSTAHPASLKNKELT